MKKKVVALIVIAIIALITFAWALQELWVIYNTGRIVTFGIECDTETIDWGILEPDTSAYYTINLRVVGDKAGTLTMTTENWNPTNASDHLTLTWNYTTGIVYNPDVWYAVELELYATPTAYGNVTNFSFDIVIIAESVA